MYWDHMNGWGSSMMIFWTILWVALLGLAVWVVAQWGRGRRASDQPLLSPPQNARDILDERLARGEIDVDEYQRLRDALGSRTPAGAAS
jgi:putative membrane protein